MSAKIKYAGAMLAAVLLLAGCASVNLERMPTGWPEPGWAAGEWSV